MKTIRRLINASLSLKFNLLSFVILGLIVSCEDDTTEQLNEVFTAEAKCFFTEEVKDVVTLNSPQGRIESSRKTVKRDLDWKRAELHELSIGRALAVPVVYEEKLFAPITRDFVYPIADASYALIYRNTETHHMELQMVTILPSTDPNEDSDGFMGKVLVEDWAGNFISGYKYADGNTWVMSTEQESSGRVENEICYEQVDDWYTCWAVVGVWDWECHYSYSETTNVCEYIPSDSYPGGGTGSPTVDDLDPNSGLKGYTSPSGSPESADEVCESMGMVFDDEIGKCVPDKNSAILSISYYLTVVLPGDDINNPYHGMKAYDANGVVYTFDENINAWLMPDLAVLLENGYPLQLYSNEELPDFDGAILSTLVTIALLEPTPIGEIVVGSIILTVFIYQAVNTFEEDRNREHCIKLYEQCVTTFGPKNMPCSQCEQFCITQGYWDFLNCPLNN